MNLPSQQRARVTRSLCVVATATALAACGGTSRTSEDMAATPPPSPASTAASSTAPTTAAPAVDSMAFAMRSGKRGVPVDVRYQFDGDVGMNKATGLQIALVPTVPGTNLQMEIKPAAGVRIDANAAPAIQKANSTDVYRHSASITKSDPAVESINVMVSMETAEGLAFGIYTIPLNAPVPGAKRSEKKPIE
jgi:hypothetical protein